MKGWPLVIALLPAATAASAGGLSLAHRVDQLLAPCLHRASIGDQADWSRPVYSAGLTHLIGTWRHQQTNASPVSPLAQGGWFCPFQDADGTRFTVIGRHVTTLDDGRRAVDIRYRVNGSGPFDTRLVMIRQGERWKVDDLVSPSMPEGLSRALRREIGQRTRL